MPLPVMINSSNPNWNYDSKMADVCFLKSEVVITQLWIELSYQIFGVEIDLDIVKRVLSLKIEPRGGGRFPTLWPPS